MNLKIESIMKIIIEFGVKGGSHTDNIILPSTKVAAQTIAAIVNAFENDSCATLPTSWSFGRNRGRLEWESETHFAAMTKMDGRLRGAASAHLWRKGTSIQMKKTVIGSW